MRIDLDRRYYNVSRYSSISLRDPSCTATFSSAYITLGSIPSLCGVEKEETGSKIIYKNKVIMSINQQSGIVSRDHDEEINFKCTYSRDGVASGVSFEPIRRVIGEESMWQLYEKRLQYLNLERKGHEKDGSCRF